MVVCSIDGQESRPPLPSDRMQWCGCTFRYDDCSGDDFHCTFHDGGTGNNDVSAGDYHHGCTRCSTARIGRDLGR